MTVKVFSVDYLDSLAHEASQSPRARQHRNIHGCYDGPCQRFLNASYIRAHRHSLDPKAETLIAVRGQFALITFDDAGAILNVVRFGKETDATVPVGADLLPDPSIPMPRRNRRRGHLWKERRTGGITFNGCGS